MIEIVFDFPVKEDAYRMHAMMNEFCQGTVEFVDNIVIINPVKKTVDAENKIKAWSFMVDICHDKDDVEIEKTIKVAGGQLNLMNGNKQIWAFA